MAKGDHQGPKPAGFDTLTSIAFDGSAGSYVALAGAEVLRMREGVLDFWYTP